MFRRADTPTRFSVADTATAARGSSRTVTHKGADNVDSNYLSSASFAYDPYESGLKSTQQLKVDWSKFENHTFFNSATAKVNVSFDRIVNSYPFDGSKKELEKFLDGLTGFEKWVLDRFPRNVGYLNFADSYLSVTDHQGSVLPELAKNKSGDSIIDPRDNPFTVEFQLYMPAEDAGSQVIVQKKHITENVGVCAYIKSGSSAAFGEVAWAVFSGSHSLVASASVSRGQFVHIAGVYDREDSAKLKLFVNGDLSMTSSNSYLFDSIVTNNASMLIGSGTTFDLGSDTITQDKQFSGSLDELRVFKLARHAEQIKKHVSRNIYAQEGLVLYYKFNEPTGSLSGDETSRTNTIVLDSSGNGLHSYISGFDFSLRSTGSIAPPLTNERLDLNPVIFPGFSDVQTLNERLLLSGSAYDQDNPNLITRLVPKHYLTDGQDYQGLESEEGPVGDSYSGDSIPGSGVLGSTQLLLALLYSWAKYFDELKLFVDSFAKLHYVDFDEKDTSPDIFLPYALREFGIKMPNLFSDAAFAQYKDGEDVEATYSLSESSLYSVQNQIMRRVLTNMGEIIRSKGTLHSIETFFRSIGIDPNNSFKIKERGGPTRRDLASAREKHMSPMLFLGFSTGSLVTSQYLSSSRVEVGQPAIAGTFITGSVFPHGISDTPSDGLWTSGSWTYEGLYRWPIVASRRRPITQSIARFHVTGTVAPYDNIVLNVLAVSGSDPKLVMYARPSSAAGLAAAPLLVISTSVDLFAGGDPWHISFGRVRGDLSGSNSVSSSYFLNASKQSFGDITQDVTASMLFMEYTGANTSTWQNVSTLNTSGAFVRIGSASVPDGTAFLTAPETSYGTRETDFDGQVSYIRFWSKALESAERREHVRNPTSAGVKNPHVNYGFNSHTTGSWERLRHDITVQQSTVSADVNGDISLFDYSQNLQNYVGVGFPLSTRVITPSVHGYSYISPNIDEAVTSEKVRVRSYDGIEKIKSTPWATSTPVYEVPKNEEPQDDPRLSIEFSLVDALNRDMITMFATLDELDLALGAPENDFSSNYSNLEHLKQVYFNRLTDKLNFRAFSDFFRWFDSSVAYFIEHLVPRKTVYYGTNFVIESHLLERHKKQYFHYDMYLREADKPMIQDRILLQQIAGVLRKF